MYLILFFQQPYKVGNVCPFYRWGNWGKKWLSNLANLTQIISCRVGRGTPICLSSRPMIFPYATCIHLLCCKWLCISVTSSQTPCPQRVSPTHSTKLDSREQWQFYLHLYLFIIVSGTFWKFNNVFVQLNAVNICFFFISEYFLPLSSYSWRDSTMVRLCYFISCGWFLFVCFCSWGVSQFCQYFRRSIFFVGDRLFHG